jgi:hypothetical protein
MNNTVALIPIKFITKFIRIVGGCPSAFTYKFGKTSIKSPEKKLGNEEALKRLN